MTVQITRLEHDADALRQLRDWVIRYNEHGIAGLSDLPKRGGAAPKLSVEEKAVLAGWVDRQTGQRPPSD